MNAVHVDNLFKSYGKNEALKGISMDVDYGEIFGIIGPDGAGKTSIFRILTTLILADSGTAQVDGLDIVQDYKQIRAILGYMPGKFSLYQDLSVEENITFFATLFGTTLEENYDLVRDIYSQLEPFKRRKAGALSGGMKQKLALSCALIHKPKVLFLDEPTTGVDPVSRKEFWGMLRRLKEQGLAIVVSTPYMDEATLCDRIALIRKGTFLDTDSPKGIVSRFNHLLFSVKGEHMPALLRDIRLCPSVFSCFAFGDTHHVVMKDNEETSMRSSLSDFLASKGHKNVQILSAEANIEDCYMYLDRGGEVI